MTDMSTTAKFVLVVEKDASFQHLLLNGVLQKLGPCILVTVSMEKSRFFLPMVCVLAGFMCNVPNKSRGFNVLKDTCTLTYRISA